MASLSDDLTAVLNAEVGGGHRFTFASTSPSVCVIRWGTRAVSVHRAGRGLLLQFFTDHSIMAHGHTEESRSAVRACVRWLGEIGLQQLGFEYPFVRFSELQLAYELGTALETQWRILLRDCFGPYRELIELARKDPVLGTLFPYVGHRFVLAADEFRSGELAGVFFVTDGWYRIYRRDVGVEVEVGGDEEIMPDVEFEGDAGAIVGYLSEQLGSRQPRSRCD